MVIATAGMAPARDKVDTWIQVQSPHFVVATNGNEKQARRIADQFERMRSLFHTLFPNLKIDPSSPIVVLAVKNDSDFRALEPQDYLAKGSLRLAGLFVRGPDKNYVLMRLEAEGEHPYATIYHEYTHLVLGKADWMPLWMNEGLAEFYQNTDIDGIDARLGQPSVENILFLRQARLLPLPVLFSVDHNSPYYHEENKGSVFYAESWAIIHYIMTTDQQPPNRLVRYADLLANGADPQSAAATAFGDLKKFQDEIDAYVRRAGFVFFKKKVPTETDPASFKLGSLTAPQSDALRADFLAYNRRTQDARALLDHVLHDEPKNVSAHETMGFIEFSERHIPEAKKWYQQAVELDSQSYLSHYYFAVMSMQESLDTAAETQVENSLRQCIKLNPSFAPAFDRLAVFLGSRGRNLDEAHMMGLSAVTLEPTNVGYRVNVANVLLRMQQGQNAVVVLRNAMKLAKTEEDNELLTRALINAEEFSTAQAEAAERRKRYEEQKKAAEVAAASEQSSDAAPAPRLVRRDFVPSGPHRFVIGVIQAVHCTEPTMELSVKLGARTFNFHSDDYYKVQFSALGFQPNGDLKPCEQLQGRPAKVEYVESADKSQAPQLLSVELHK
jgi:tetratricopeptide (TPR) repeat protein